MYVVVNQIAKLNFGDILARFKGTFPKKPCKSTILRMDYQIWRAESPPNHFREANSLP